jgi:hypothetical protein
MEVDGLAVTWEESASISSFGACGHEPGSLVPLSLMNYHPFTTNSHTKDRTLCPYIPINESN